MDKKPGASLSVRLIFFSSLIVLLAVTVMGLLFTFFLNRRFRDYLVQENTDVRLELVETFTRYMEASGTVDSQWMEQFSNVYMEQGMFISVNSADGELMWSCMDESKAICATHMVEMGLEELDVEKLNIETYEIPAGLSGEPTMLNISFIPPDDFSANDRFFLNETYRMLLLSIIITVLISAVLSVFLSRSISRPLGELRDYALRLSSHDYGASGSGESPVREIAELHNAVKNLAASLESQERLRRRLSADVSHELRTPLASLQSTLEAMIDGIWPVDNERLETCRLEILRLSGLVTTLDDLHKYDNPLPALVKSRVRIERSLKKAAALFDKDLEAKKIQLSINCPDLFISGDENRLKQVWINLLSNSIKFTPEGGFISISARSEGALHLIFSDSGTGIAPEDLPHIFERFYKTDSSRNDKGSGLGLSIVREIITLHGGLVSAESQRGKGTDICIKLPLDHPAAEKQA